MVCGGRWLGDRGPGWHLGRSSWGWLEAGRDGVELVGAGLGMVGGEDGAPGEGVGAEGMEDGW